MLAINSVYSDENTAPSNKITVKLAMMGVTGEAENQSLPVTGGKHRTKDQSGSAARKTLQTLQPAAQEGALTRPAEQLQKCKEGSKKKADSSQKIKPHKQKSIHVFKDPSPLKEAASECSHSDCCSEETPGGALEEGDAATSQDVDAKRKDCCLCGCHENKKQKTAEEEAHELMVQEEVSLEYWRELAERRREALNDSLHENEQLYTENSELKEQNEKLKGMADQAEYFASMLELVVGENTEAELETEESEEEEKAEAEVEEEEKAEEEVEEEEKEGEKEEQEETGDCSSSDNDEEKVDSDNNDTDDNKEVNADETAETHDGQKERTAPEEEKVESTEAEKDTSDQELTATATTEESTN